MDPLRELRRHYQDGRLLPFIGAGASMSVTWEEDGAKCRGLSWSELIDEAARKLGFDPSLLRVRGEPLQILEYFRIKNAGMGPLVNWLMTSMRAPNSALKGSALHEELAKLENCGTFYTTNYDDYLERTFELFGRPWRKIALEAHMGRASGETEIVKFHGDFDWPETMVVTESDYSRRLSFQSAMDFRLRSDLLGRAVLFIGFSFNDSNVAYLFHMVNTLFSGLPDSESGRRAFILFPDPSDFEQVLFRERNIHVIPIRRASRNDDIVSVLREIRR